MIKTKLTENELIELIATYQSALKKLQFQVSNTEGAIQNLQKELDKIQSRKAKITAKKATAAKKTVAVKKTTASANGTATNGVAKRRGRPRLAKNTDAVIKPITKSPAKKTTATSNGKATAAPAKRRGRPRKIKTDIVATAAKRAQKAKAPAAKKATSKTKTTVKAASKPAAKTVAKKAPAAKKPAVKKASPASKAKNGYRMSPWDDFLTKAVKKKKALTRAQIDATVAKSGGSLIADMDEKKVKAKVSNVLHKLTNTKSILKKDRNTEGKSVYVLA